MLSQKAERRLTKLIEYMESLPREARAHFDMGYWFRHHGDNHYHDLYGKSELTRRDLNLCGTSACALGWAATIPSFRRDGLRLTPTGVYFGNEWCEGAEAAVVFFDITDDMAYDLFGGANRDKTPKQWAKRARKVLRAWRKA